MVAISKPAPITPVSRVEATEPFPRERLADAYHWQRHTSTVINGRSYSIQEYLAAMAITLDQVGARSWGLWVDRELVGLGLFEPIWRVGELVDGSIHILLARRAWGQKVIETAAATIIPSLFNQPSLLRLSGHTPSTYRPGLQVAEALGFQYEGRLLDAVRVDGQLRDITLTGLTRARWIEQQQMQEGQI